MGGDIDVISECARILGLEPTAEVRKAIEALLTDDSMVWQLLDKLSVYRTPVKLGFSGLDDRIAARMRERWGNRVDASLLRKRVGLDPQARRLLTVLSSRVGEWMTLRELMLYNEFSLGTPRRLRTLKTEHGAFGVEQRGQGRDSSYRMMSSEVDLDRCAEYWLKNNIRESKLPVHERLLALLKARMPDQVTIEEFRYVDPGASAGRGRARGSQSSTDRRVRDLREQGWQVYSHQDKVVVGLKAGEYVMLSLDRIPAYERLNSKQWKQVMEATDYRCFECGWGPKDGPSQGRKIVEVHHKDPQNARPEDVNELSNLVPLCNVCHDAV